MYLKDTQQVYPNRNNEYNFGRNLLNVQSNSSWDTQAFKGKIFWGDWFLKEGNISLTCVKPMLWAASQAIIYLFKSKIGTLEKGLKYVQN